MTAEQEDILTELAQQCYDEQQTAVQSGGLVVIDGVACTASDRTYSFMLDESTIVQRLSQ